MQRGAKDCEKVGWKKGRENERRQGREAREARMEIREAKAETSKGVRCGDKKLMTGDNKLVMPSGSRKQDEPGIMGGRQRKTLDRKENRERQA